MQHDPRDELGATSAEYLFLMVFVAIAILVGATLFGSSLNDGFDQSADAVEQEVGTATN